MNDFFSKMNETLTNSENNVSITENGAVGYRTTGKKLVDMNFAVSSMRDMEEDAIRFRFAELFGEDFVTAVVWLFFARDIRGNGMGERRLFRIGMKYLAEEWPQTARKLLHLVAEYGRWDDLIYLLDVPNVKNDVLLVLLGQWRDDLHNMNAGKSISLLAKWLPSANTSSKETRRLASVIIGAMGCTPRAYRKTLSSLRKYLNVTECKMSANEWGEIAYEAVPSRANLLYNAAFLKHDTARRESYLDKVEKGEAKINSSALFPHDIVAKYVHGGLKHLDASLEALWSALPNYVQDGDETIVVADGSDSMTSRISANSFVSALDVANSLAIYFAERLPEPFRNKYITFSMTPQLVNLSGASTLKEKINICLRHDECANTNIEAVFDLILKTAIGNGLPQKKLPKNILILSDMEFDTCVSSSSDERKYPWSLCHPTPSLFSEISAKYEAHGYKLPRLVFWNICSRTGTIPVKENELGVALVSGFSPAIAKMVTSNKTDPYEILMEALNAPRYDAVREALK